jgi:hypothetical protein
LTKLEPLTLAWMLTIIQTPLRSIFPLFWSSLPMFTHSLPLPTLEPLACFGLTAVPWLEGRTDSSTLAHFRPHPRYWYFASIKPQGPGGYPSSPALLVSPVCKHYGATQYSAPSAPLLDVRPTAGTRIKPCHRVA